MFKVTFDQENHGHRLTKNIEADTVTLNMNDIFVFRRESGDNRIAGIVARVPRRNVLAIERV